MLSTSYCSKEQGLYKPHKNFRKGPVGFLEDPIARSGRGYASIGFAKRIFHDLYKIEDRLDCRIFPLFDLSF